MWKSDLSVPKQKYRIWKKLVVYYSRLATAWDMSFLVHTADYFNQSPSTRLFLCQIWDGALDELLGVKFKPSKGEYSFDIFKWEIQPSTYSQTYLVLLNEKDMKTLNIRRLCYRTIIAFDIPEKHYNPRKSMKQIVRDLCSVKPINFYIG